MKKHIIKDVLMVFTAVMLTSATAFAMEPSVSPELHPSTQAAQVVQVPDKSIPAPQTETTSPVAEVAAQEPSPAPAVSKVDSSIPERVFCGSPHQRTWKTPLLVNTTMGRDMAAAKGWTGGQWDALLELWSCESSWNNFAENPSSAFGIAQFLDSTWGLPGLVYANCSKTVDAREQIRCGLEYIQVVYGTPASALDFHYRNNSY